MKQKRIFRTALALFLLLALCIPASAARVYPESSLPLHLTTAPARIQPCFSMSWLARDVKATFFVSGYRAKGYPETLGLHRRGRAPAGKPHAEPRKPQHALQQQNRK